MEQRKFPESPEHGALPRPVVLGTEDLATVAAASASLAAAPALGNKILIAGGLPAAGPMMAAA